MKAFLLAAGHGTRLRPLTDNLPKCLVPIAGKPMLQIWFEICRSAGITEILINVHAHVAQVRSYVAEHAGDLKVSLSEEHELLGSAGTLRANRQWLGEVPEFWVLYSDVLTTLNFSDMLAQHRRNGGKATLGVYRVDNPRRCGILTTDPENRITSFIEKPDNPANNQAFSGIMLASPKICDLIPPGKSAPDIGFDLLPRLVGQMHAYPISEFLVDVGTREIYERAQEEWPDVVGV